jgi:hypothetical protein
MTTAVILAAWIRWLTSRAAWHAHRALAGLRGHCPACGLPAPSHKMGCHRASGSEQ